MIIQSLELSHAIETQTGTAQSVTLTQFVLDMCDIWFLPPTSEIIYCVCETFNSSTPCIYKNQHSMLKGLMPSYFPLANLHVCVSIVGQKSARGIPLPYVQQHVYH